MALKGISCLCASDPDKHVLPNVWQDPNKWVKATPIVALHVAFNFYGWLLSSNSNKNINETLTECKCMQRNQKYALVCKSMHQLTIVWQNIVKKI